MSKTLPDLDELQQACGVCFWRIDLRDQVVWVGSGWQRLLGLDPEHQPVHLQGWLALFHSVDRAEVESLLAGPSLRRGLALEARLRHQDGQWRWIRFRGRALEDGHIWLGLAEETTFSKSLALRSEERRRAAEEALRESEELYRGLYERTTEHLFLVAVESDGQLRYAGLNPAHQLATGLDESKLKGKTPHECLPQDIADHVLANYQRCIQTRRPVTYEEELQLPNGRINWVTQLIPLQGRDGSIARLLGICTDLTRLKEQEQALRLAQKQESIGKVASGMAHDFNNLLTVIICQLGLLECELNGNEDLSHQVEQIFQAAQRAAELTKGLLRLGGRQGEKKALVSWDQVLQKLEAILASLVGPAIRLTYHLESVRQIEAVPIHLDQILLNLVGNAAEAIGPRAGWVEVRLSDQRLGEQACLLFPADPLPPGDYVSLEISDSGPGMDAAVVPSLFESGVSSKGEGRGLGLATVRSLVLEMGGGLTVVSDPGHGTRFKLFFPCCQPAKDSTPHLSEMEASELGFALPLGGRFLFCSEDLPLRRSMAALADHLGIGYEEASHPSELLTLLAKRPRDFDVVGLDVNSKHQQDSLLGALAAINPELRSLIVSGLPAGELLVGNSYAAPGAYLQKPFTWKELARRLRYLVTGQT